MQNSIGQTPTVQVPNYSGVNIQIFNPAVNTGGYAQPQAAPVQPQAPVSYPQNYYTQQLGHPTTGQPTMPAMKTSEENKPEKKTEKRDVIKLTDEYIKTLESYLNSSDAEVRLMGAKEVVARLEEDESRKSDVALNALVNKMLQDPSAPVSFIAMATLNARMAKGNDTTVQLLQNIQQQKTGYGQNALMATNCLLKMSGDTIEKEFEVKNNSKTTRPEQENQKGNK